MAAVMDRDATLQGHYAGISTRFASFVVDILIIALAFAVAAQAFDYLVSAVFGRDFSLRDATLASDLLLAGWAWFYLAYPIAIGGRTVGMTIFGLKIVRADGEHVRTRHAVVRAAVLPLSFLLLGFGFLLIVLRRDRRALQDLIAHTAVVYSWDARSARLRRIAKERDEPV